MYCFDCWTSGSTHYLDMFSSFCDESLDGFATRLIAFSPLKYESHLDAREHVQFLSLVLRLFDNSLDNISLITADNCNLNKALANPLGVPLAGCASHRLNGAIQDFLEQKLLSKINKVMNEISNMVLGVKLRLLTPLTLVLRNVTRWNLCFQMLQRLEILEKQLSTTAKRWNRWADFKLNWKATCCTNKIQLKGVESVWKALWDHDVTIVNKKTLLWRINRRVSRNKVMHICTFHGYRECTMTPSNLSLQKFNWDVETHWISSNKLKYLCIRLETAPLKVMKTKILHLPIALLKGGNCLQNQLSLPTTTSNLVSQPQTLVSSFSV